MKKEIVVAGGCFWGVQEYYRRLKGVEETRVGYAQGSLRKPKLRAGEAADQRACGMRANRV